MQKKTVSVTKITGWLLLIGLLLLSGALSIGVLAQTVVPESYIPLVQKESNAEQPQPEPSQTPPRPTPQIAGQADLDGRVVPQTVLEFYRTTGQEVTGRPVTDYEFNENRQRYEMFFENMGIYVNPNDPDQKVHIIPLGLEHFTVQPTPDLEAAPIIPSIIRLFDLKTREVNPVFRGEMLDPLNQDSAGNPIRIFENMVMKVELSDPGLLLWETLPQELGIQVQPSVPELLDDERFVFSPTGEQPGFGHNIPLEFWNFIKTYGGPLVSGAPITEIYYTDDNNTVIRQCFEHMCLDYDLLADEVRPAPLGVEFYKRLTQEQELKSNPLVLNLLVWEASTSIPQDQPQTIFAYLSQGDQPVINVKPVLEIAAPDGQRLVYHMPPTDDSGISSIEIPPVAASNGAIIPYEVCLIYRDATRFCVQSQYFIWNVP